MNPLASSFDEDIWWVKFGGRGVGGDILAEEIAFRGEVRNNSSYSKTCQPGLSRGVVGDQVGKLAPH